MKKLISNLILGIMLFNSVFAFADEDDCTTGQVWSDSLNRCVLTTDTVSSLTSASNCQELSGDAYSQCFYDNVSNQMDEAQASNDIPKASKPESSYAISSIVTLGSAYILWKKQASLNSCGQTSMWLMLGAGVSSLLGELYAQYSYKSKLSGLQKKYTKRMNLNPTEDDDTDATSENIVTAINENQQIAFEYQAEQESAKEKAHKAREVVYKMAFALYTASAVASLWDYYQSMGSGCAAASYTPQYKSGFEKKYAGLKNSLLLNKNLFGKYYFIEELKQSEMMEIVQRKVWAVFNFTAYADKPGIENIKKFTTYGKRPTTPTTPTPEGGFDLLDSIKEVADTVDQSIDGAIKNPLIRAAFAGVLAGYSIYQGNQAAELADQAKERVKHLNEIASNFAATGVSYAGCSDEDRDDSSKASCYCYNSDGTANSERSSASICSTSSSTVSLSETTYAATSNTTGAEDTSAGCLTSSSYDADCSSCSDDSNGPGCFSMNGKVALGKLATIDGLTDAMRDTAKFTSGKLGTSSLDSAAADNLAVAARNARNTLAASNPKISKTASAIDAESAKLSRALASNIASKLKNGSLSNPLSSSSLGTLSAGSDDKESTEDEKKEEVTPFATAAANGGKMASNNSKSSALDFDFGLDGDKKGGVEIVGEDNTDKEKFKYQYNDINENEDANIFQLISNRYHSTGLKALFKKN